MGQEIVHCCVCGIRLRGTDFDRGEAVRVDHATYCRKCSANLILPEPMPTSSSTATRKALGSTGRIPTVTPRKAMEPATGSSAFPPALLWGGGALLIILVIAVVVVLGGRSAPPPPQPAPQPEVTRRPTPAPAPAPAVTPTPAVERKPGLDPHAELSEIDRKVAAAAAQENFRQGFDLLAAAKDRIDTLEWVAEIQRRTRDLDGKVKTLYTELTAKLDQARKRSADAEAAAILDRIKRWELPSYGPPSEQPVTAAPEPTPAPEPAPTPAPEPAVPVKPQPAPIATKWTVLSPKRMTATEGVVLTAQEDGSILASGPSPLKSRYSIVVQTELKGIWGFRLEALPDPSMPLSGPGRNGNGNFMLSEFQVQVLSDPSLNSGAPVAFERIAAADFTQEGFPPAHALDGIKDSGWAILPQVGKAHEAMFDSKAALTSAGPLTLLIVLDFQSIYEYHQIGRFRLSATTSKGVAYEAATRVPVIDPARVSQAIKRGVAWLRLGTYPADYLDWSPNKLILWTFVHAGVPESDPDFQKRLKQMLDAPLEKTYRVALQAMILEELDRVAYQFRIWQCAQFLVDNQCLNGQWHYGTPTELPKGVPTPAKPPVPTPARLDADGRRLKPKIARKMIARKTRDGPAEGDNSNSQYAALGLRACFDAGVAIPEETLYRAMRWWVECQHPDEKREGEYAARGWGYTTPTKEGRPYAAMTVGGISSLTIYDYMLGRDWKKTTSIKAGVNWVAQSWTVTSNYYYLYGLERAGVLYGHEKFGRYAWYPQAAQFILDNQDASGAWVTRPWWEKMDEQIFNTWNTCFAILFLRHATRPLVASEDRR
jgi:hypothetical protein